MLLYKSRVVNNNNRGVIMDIQKDIKSLKEELIALRRDFHKHPELGFEEYRSSEIIANYLRECGLEVKTRIAKTGVVGLLRGSESGPTILLRADMDALPVKEENDVEYKSVYEGKSHACGHDGHMAMLLVAAKILSKYKKEIKGNIKFLFQPNEEDAGAKFMIEEGVLENPSVDAAHAIHLWTPIKSGDVGISPGPVMAAHDNFKIIINGKGGHTSAPQVSIDPIIAAAGIIQSAQSIQSREINVLKPTSLMFGKITAGTAPNIIPEQAMLEGSIRYLYAGEDSSEEKPRIRLKTMAENVCNVYRATCNVEFFPSSLAVINDPTLTEIIKNETQQVLNVYGGSVVPYVCMAGEDFSEFGVRVPSVLSFVGAGNEEKETNYPHHHPKFNIDEDVLTIGVEMHIRSVLRFLSN